MMKTTWFGFAAAIAVASCGSDGGPTTGGASGSAPGGTSASGGLGGSAGGASSTSGAAGAPITAAGTPNEGGASSTAGAGNAGSDAGAGGAGVEPDPDGDPVPVTPNLNGLVPHSTKWMLVSLGRGLNQPDDIRMLDLETKELTDANPDHVINIQSALSPDERTYFFSNGNGAALSGRIIHLEPDGFVPARIPQDYAMVPGAFSVLSWSVDSRFALMASGSSVEVMDVWLERRVHTDPIHSIVAAFAPQGYHFFYDAALTDGYEPPYARVTQAGTSPILKLPADADKMVFDASGQHLYYGLEPKLESARIFRLSLADGQTQELTVAQPGEVARSFGMLPLSDSVLVNVQPGLYTSTFIRRVFVDPQKEPVKVADADAFHHSDDNNLLLIRNFADKTLQLVQVEPYAAQPLPLTYVETNSTGWAGIVGDHAFYLAPDGLHLDSIGPDGELRDQRLSDAGEYVYVCASPYSYEPKNKFAYLRGEPRELVYIDLTQEPPAVVGSYQPPAGSSVGCPTWGDGDTALGLMVVAADKTRTAHVTTWRDAAPEAPQPALTGVASIYAVMHR
jgi:hypothetical protein